MTKQLERQKIRDIADILPPLEIHAKSSTPVEVRRTFDLPPVLHVGLCGVFLAYLAIMGIGLADPGLIIPMAICVLFTVAMFAVPALWARMDPSNPMQSLRWAQFTQHGIMTATGRSSARAVFWQMYIVPLVVLGWGVAIVSIWAATA